MTEEKKKMKLLPWLHHLSIQHVEQPSISTHNTIRSTHHTTILSRKFEALFRQR